VLRKCSGVVALTTLPLAAYLYVLGPDIVRVLLGDQWDAAGRTFQILVLGLLFRTSYVIFDAVASATGAVYRVAWRTWLTGLTVVGGAVVGSMWGVTGVAVAVLGAYAVNWAVMAHLALRITGLSQRDFVTTHGPGVLSGGLVAAMSWATLALTDRLGAMPLVDTVAAALTAGLVLICAWGWAPRFFLGPDGIWMVGLFGNRFRSVFGRGVRPAPDPARQSAPYDERPGATEPVAPR
jgi:PST family polysaccharide transporter